MDDFENQIKRNKKYKYTGTRQQEEFKRCYDKLGLDKICKKTGIKEDLIKDYILGIKKIPEMLYIFIADSTGCTYDYLVETSDFRTEQDKIDKINELNNIVNAGKEAEKELNSYRKKNIYEIDYKGKQASNYPYKGTRPQIEVEKLVREKGVDYVSDKLNKDKSTVYNYKSGKYSVPKDLFPIIEEETGASVEYLLGVTDTYSRDVRKIELEKEIKLKQKELDCLNDKSDNAYKRLEGLHHIELITDKVLDGLNKVTLNINSSINEIDTDIKLLNGQYADIVSYMISNVNLWATLIEAAERLIATKTDIGELIKFENYHNRNIDIGYKYAISITPEEDAELRIKKAIVGIFFEYIAMKEKELNLDEINLEAEEDKMIKQMLKDKNRNK